MTVGQGNASDQYEDRCQHFVTAPHFSIEITGEKVSYSVISGLSFSHHIVVWSVKIESTEIGQNYKDNKKGSENPFLLCWLCPN